MNTITASSPLPSVTPAAGRPLLRWLGRYVRKRRVYLTGMGLAAGLAVTALLCLTSSTMDVMLTLPRWLRWTVLILTAAFLVMLAARGIQRAANVRRRNAMDEIEALLPARGQLMRTALEEASAPASPNPARAMLTAGLLGQAGEIAQRFHPEKSLPWKKYRRQWLYAASAAGVLAVLFFSWRDFGTAVRRFVQPGANITFTQVAFEQAPKEIVAGTECTVQVRLSGRNARAPMLDIRRGDVPDEPLVMKRDASKPGVYVASIGKPGAAVTLRARAGDGSTEDLVIPVIYPPKLREISAVLTYPAYTGLKPAKQKSPDIEAVEGTEVTVSITTDRALGKGVVEFSNGTTASLTFNGPVTTFSAPLQRGKLTWKLEASDERGLKPPGAGGKWIGMDDKPPKVEWITPKNDTEATPLSEVTLRAKAKDDFGLLETGIVLIAGGKQKVLMTDDFKGSDGVPVTAVADALAAIEDVNVNIRDNVKVFAFARDRYPAAPGKERRGVSDLRNIDIRQFKVWRAMMNGGAPPPMPPKAAKALKKLEQLIKEQRGVVNTVFRFKEENLKEPKDCQETAAKENGLSADTNDVKVALQESEMPPPPDDLLLLDTASQQMKEAATALEPADLEPAWTNSDGALSSLLELRKEFMKIMSKEGKPCDCESKPDDFKLPSLTELAKEAERLANEEAEVSKGVPLAKSSTADGDKLAGRQAAAQSDGGELFDKIVTHPEVTGLAQSRMEEAEKSMSAATHELRDRNAEGALPPLDNARDSLSHLAKHLRGLDTRQAANTLQMAAEMAKKSAEGLKGEGEGKGKSEEGKKGDEGEGKKGEDGKGELAGKDKKGEGKEGKDGKESDVADSKNAGKGGEGKQSQEGKGNGDKPGSLAGNQPGEGKGKGEGKGNGKDDMANNKPGEGSGKGDKPGEGKGSSEAEAARDAATINDWLKNLAKSESLGRSGERLGALQKDARTEDLAKRLAALAAQAGANVSSGPAGDPKERKELAEQMEKLSAELAAEHNRMVQGTLEKMAAAQAAAKAMKEGRNGKPGDKPGNGKGAGNKPSEGKGKGQGDKPGEGEGKGQGDKPGQGEGKGQGKGDKPGEGEGKGQGNKPGQGGGDSANGSSQNGGGTNIGKVRPQTGQGWGLLENNGFSSAKPGSLKYMEDFADMLKDFKDTELTELSDEFIRELLAKGYNRDIDPKTLGQIEARLETLIQEVIQRQLLAGKSDRVPPDFEARVETYFRRLSEDT
ncbi:MAG TPA: hypothetical protein VHM91_24135, partial [Verrucomicrobiales bacterium]|nr:hypothetical protein [Verrucomicrobiales bacterium]